MIILTARLAEALRDETGFDVTGHPDFHVQPATFTPGAPDIEIRPETAQRMAEACQRAMDAVRAGEVRHG